MSKPSISELTDRINNWERGIDRKDLTRAPRGPFDTPKADVIGHYRQIRKLARKIRDAADLEIAKIQAVIDAEEAAKG